MILALRCKVGCRGHDEIQKLIMEIQVRRGTHRANRFGPPFVPILARLHQTAEEPICIVLDIAPVQYQRHAFLQPGYCRGGAFLQGRYRGRGVHAGFHWYRITIDDHQHRCEEFVHALSMHIELFELPDNFDRGAVCGLTWR